MKQRILECMSKDDTRHTENESVVSRASNPVDTSSLLHFTVAWITCPCHYIIATLISGLRPQLFCLYVLLRHVCT